MLSRRPLSTTSPRPAYKDDQDRRSLKPRAHEYTGSGSDEEAAHNADSAFNPDKTRPEQERTTAGAGGKAGDNPLEVSPANHEVSKGGQGAMEDKPQQGHKSNKSTSSTASGGGANKGGGSGEKR
ncbi:ketoacyl-synt-domain-containing protein [Apiospora arundinis]